MPGKILIFDTVATNRILLKAQLARSFHQVFQVADFAEASTVLRQSPPDMILLGSDDREQWLRICRVVRSNPATSQMPVLALSTSGDGELRRATLEAGADDVLTTPVAESVLLARVRSLLRRRGQLEDLWHRGGAPHWGFGESQGAFAPRSQVLVASGNSAKTLGWQAKLRAAGSFNLSHGSFGDILSRLGDDSATDVIVIAPGLEAPEAGLRLLSELRARHACRNAGFLVLLDKLPEDQCAQLSIAALDLGADDVMTGGFEPQELALRISTLAQRKRFGDRLRKNVQDGLHAALRDPLTGLHNRRFAMPQLARIAGQTARENSSFAVMVADLDLFKRINDDYGHSAGDAVLVEVAKRLGAGLRSVDLLARIGGEEFLIALPDSGRERAARVARRLCAAIAERPFRLAGRNETISVTVSIGVAFSSDDAKSVNSPEQIISRADKALYGAKSHGRNQVTLSRPAA